MSTTPLPGDSSNAPTQNSGDDQTGRFVAQLNGRVRPLSPHLQIWRWHVTMAASILNRMTGTALSVGSVLIALWLLALAFGPDAYATFTGYREDDFRPFVFRTRDYGANWESIAGDLPDEPVNVLIEDLENPAVLYVGTEFGVLVSVDGGGHWSRFGRDLPRLAVHDLLIHPRDRDLIAGTHAQGFFVVDDVTPMQSWKSEFGEAVAHLWPVRDEVLWQSMSEDQRSGNGGWSGANPLVGARIAYWLGATCDVRAGAALLPRLRSSVFSVRSFAASSARLTPRPSSSSAASAMSPSPTGAVTCAPASTTSTKPAWPCAARTGSPPGRGFESSAARPDPVTARDRGSAGMKWAKARSTPKAVGVVRRQSRRRTRAHC